MLETQSDFLFKWKDQKSKITCEMIQIKSKSKITRVILNHDFKSNYFKSFPTLHVWLNHMTINKLSDMLTRIGCDVPTPHSKLWPLLQSKWL